MSGEYTQLPPYESAARCSCGALKVGTLAEVNTWTRGHDDSPWRKHVVTWAGAGFGWPASAAELAERVRMGADS